MTALIANIWYLFTKLKISSKNVRSSKYKLPLPKQCHMTLTDDVIGDRTIFVIGDVHGCLDELNELLEIAQKEMQTSSILPIFVGDLLSKGPKSIETMRKLRNLEHYAVRGNHDEAVLRQALNVREIQNYTLLPRYEWVPELSDEDLDYLRELPYTIRIPKFNALIVHAGLVPDVPLERQDLTDMIVMRNVKSKADSSGYVACELRDAGQPWASIWSGPEHVYFGHDAVRKLQNYSHATGLDTGCLYGFQLTGLFLDGCKKMIQVQAKSVYRKP